MTTGITEMGTEYQYMSRKMDEPNPEARSKQEKGTDASTGVEDTVEIGGGVSRGIPLKFEDIDEEEAAILSQLVANDLYGRSVGMSTPEGMDVLRASA